MCAGCMQIVEISNKPYEKTACTNKTQCTTRRSLASFDTQFFFYCVFMTPFWFSGYPACSFCVEFLKFLCNAGF